MSVTAESTTDREIVVTRVFDAPRESVWKAWTDPKLVVEWWGPIGFTTTIETMDVRVGGIWKLVMHGPDGTDYPNKSIFTEVIEPERLSYTHCGGKPGSPGATFQATATFEDRDGKTHLTFRMVFPTAADLEMVAREYRAVEGASQTIERLAKYLASM